MPHRSDVRNNPLQDMRRQIKAARTQKGWSQLDLAKAAKVSRGSVQNLESGRRLDETTETKIEAALGRPVGWLDQLRSSTHVEPAIAPPSFVDPEEATLGDYQVELSYFHQVFKDSPNDMERLRRLLEMHHQLQLRLLGSAGVSHTDTQRED